jgi:sulfite reductase (NADPH) flavoprotein alpha-component
VRYDMRKRRRAGVASSMLADRAPKGTELAVYVQASPHFRLPAPDVPIVMIGPGTGVAPFRAFLEEREATAAKGRSWLFFGTRHARDVFYVDELRALMERGTLTRLDCAYSRDTPQRVYVQHKMRDAQKELYAWIAAGAHVYLCGDAKHMAPDVQNELIDIISRGATIDRDAAVAKLRELESEGRYAKDVY